MKIEIIPAQKEQEPILANLLELYSYEFTSIFDFDIGDNGFYGYKWLPLYWSEENRFPFLIHIDGKIAGFVLVQKGSPISDEKNIFDIAEFFIMRKYQRKQIGTQVAKLIWQMFQGAWQVRVLVGNRRASAFWLKAIEKFTQSQFTVNERKIEEDLWLVYTFESTEL